MSSPYQPKNKQLANVVVVDNTVYNQNRDSLLALGRVQRGMSAYVVSPARRTGSTSFVEDSVALTKRTKNEIVKFFNNPQNAKKDTLYLVVPRSKAGSKKSSKGGGF